MCNKFHQDPIYNPRPISKNGTAWKIFEDYQDPTGKQRLIGPWGGEYFNKHSQIIEPTQWVTWSNEIDAEFIGDGFCAFANKEDAEAYFKYELSDFPLMYNKRKMLEIEYKMGVGQITSREINGNPYEIIIVKKFRIKPRKET